MRGVRPAGWPVGCLAVLGMVGMAGCEREAGVMRPAGEVEVAVFTVVERPLMLTTELPGRTSAYRVAEVRPQVNGLIEKRLFTEGAEVAAGEPLYQIDAAPFRAVLASAEAALGRAEANLAVAKLRAGRFQHALAAKGVSQQEADDAAAVLAQAEADLRYHQALVETARINLGYARVTSPIAGRIGASSVTDGAIVTAYQPVPLAVIQQLDPIYVDVPQSATELLRLRRKLGGGRAGELGGGRAGEPGGGRVAGEGGGLGEVRLLLPDGTGYGHAGALQFRDVSVDPTTGTVTLRMVFPNPDKVLLPGMFVRAVVPEGEDEQAILIPQQTVARTPKGEPLAWLVGAGGKVEVRKLTLERAIGDRWLVSGGLAPGERIIAEGVQKVRPGMVVKEVPFEEPAAGGGGAAEQAAAAN